MQSVTIGPGVLAVDQNYKSGWLNLPAGTVLLKAVVLGDQATFDTETTQFSFGIYHSPGGTGEPKHVMSATFEGRPGAVAPSISTLLVNTINNDNGEPVEIITRVRVQASNLGSATTLGVRLEAWTVDVVTLLQLRRDILLARGIQERVNALLASAS